MKFLKTEHTGSVWLVEVDLEDPALLPVSVAVDGRVGEEQARLLAEQSAIIHTSRQVGDFEARDAAVARHDEINKEFDNA